jgi:hypothetical protein
MQVGLALSFVAVIKNGEFDIEVYKDSFNQYFFPIRDTQPFQGTWLSAPGFPRRLTVV